MKAIFAVPGPDGGTFEYRDIPTPSPGDDEVLVAIHAAGTNRGELIQGPRLRSTNPALRPMRAGIEFAGTIARFGAGVTGWHQGERVMGRGPGCYAEHTIVNQRALMRIPEGMGFAEAAAIPNVFVTAHDAIVSAAAVREGESVMVTAGSSGVGTAAIQIARLLKATPVIATTRSMAKANALSALGADQVVDVTSPHWRQQVESTAQRGVDAIIDQVGGPMLADNIALLAIKGRLVSVGRNAGRVGECDLDEVARKRAAIVGVTFRTRSAEQALQCSERFAAQMLGAFSDGRLKPTLDRAFPFDRLAEAHAYMLGDTQIGKIVLVMPERVGEN
jgi:NADPH2:quinone reductase